MSKKGILIVDDIQMNRDIIKECLKSEFEIYEASDGVEALDKIISIPNISLVILDIFMPVKDGFFVLQQMRERDLLSNIPVIVSSGADEEKYELKAIEMGAIDYISKPIEPTKIKLRVYSALEKTLNNRLIIQNELLKRKTEEEKKFKAVIELTNTAVIEFDKEFKNASYDDRVSKLLSGEYDSRDFFDIIIQDKVIVDLEDIHEVKCFFNQGKNIFESSILEVKMRSCDNIFKWYRLQLLRLIENDKTKGYILTINDIDIDKKNEDELLYLAIYDKLTGIYNIDSFYQHTSKLIKENPKKQYVLIRIDIEKFKLINEVFGYNEGNNLLKYIAKKIEEFCDDRGVYGRVGQDVFVMCIPYDKDVVDRILVVSTNDLKNYYLNFNIKVLFGIYIIKNLDLPIESMLDRAALAISSIKSHSSKNFAIYNDELRERLVEEQQIVNEMDKALMNNEFEVFLQPLCRIFTKEVFAAEALVRWKHPKKGYVLPGKFIPIFEKNGYITRLDRYVWEECCKLLKKWKEEGKQLIPISVNISRVNVYNPNLCYIFDELVQKYGIEKQYLNLEITESVYMSNPDLLATTINKLQSKGFTVLMDDFGSGYSSLNMLKDISVNVLKFDFRFLYGDNDAERGGCILSSLVRMAKNIGMPIIVEGVETEEQARFLQSIGCNMAQGYYYYRPMPIQQFEEIRLTKSIEEKNNSNKFSIYKTIFNMRKETNVLMNSIIEAAAIVEVSSDSIEAIRWNDEYAKLIKMNISLGNDKATNIDRFILPEYTMIVNETFKLAAKTNNITKCYYKRKDLSNKVLELEMKARFLAKDEKVFLYYISVSKIE